MILPIVFTSSAFVSQPVTEMVPFEPSVPPASAALEDPPPVMHRWTGSVNVGASYSDGNTDARSINAAIDAVRRGEKDRWTAKGYWNYGETKDSTGESAITQRRAGASLKYDYFLTKKLYAFAIAGIETDLLADIRKRYYAGGGLGYQWKETERFKWGSEAGITYFVTDYRTSDDKEGPAARLANNIAWQINEHTSLENSLEAFPSLEDKNDVYGKSDTKLKATLSKAMFAQLQWVYQYTNVPADGKERNDNLVVLGVGWSF